MLNSTYSALGSIMFPEHLNRQVYMHPFDLGNPTLGTGLLDYEVMVNTLCSRAGQHKGTAYLTVDEKVVKAGMSQRRPYPHVDGRYEPTRGRWGHDNPKWIHPGDSLRMSVIVASTVPGCRAWKGVFDGEPTECGDLRHIRFQLDEGKVLPANRGYLFSPDCVHESMLFEHDTARQFVRIALPV